jgi:hypothetical protein
VDDEIPFKSTDKQFIGSFQRAVTAVHENMTEEELEEANNIVDLWNSQGAPQDIQLK